MQTFAKSLTSEGTSLSLRHERQTTSPEKSSKGQGKSSPLRKALRQPRDAVSIVPNTVSPSKNLPARHHARTPRAFPPSANALPKLSPPSSVDELILAAPSQTSIKARSIGHHGSNAAQTCSSSRNSNETGIDEDEIAAPLYTPIKSPYTTQYAQSPPTEEHMMDDDDLWTPSVPLELAQSFSEMSFREEDLVVPLKEPAHTFFDDDGEMIISKTLPMTNEYDQIEADHLHTSASDIKVYVDCTSTDQTSSSKYFSSILSALGATTLCRWNWNPETQTTPRKQPRVGLTHVVFFDGAIRTLKKVKEARRLGVEVKCVGLSWVVQCQNSGRLTIGTEGHEIDVEAELLRMTQSPRKSREPLSITDATKPAERPSAIGPSDIFASRDFEDENEDVLSRGPGKTLAAARPIVTLAARAPSKTTKLTDFEVQQLALARRNSAKFRPSISSPLSKKTWRA
ncbi:Putative uncharacterized protein [Taphrina deformans PYCC 5710]|uniref:BRCT domain-containing protein n=1 Tax=Taphrina deformans (strain PYCC 5710 / ATCC 11124 / CBS 356.35 / IMI 108563 / JCM 9778 / NBRC 8474) TaxID=1097556 RepID=R4X9L6_TAPDE|nr:Putative uncharacterized protein [Taphrina deformans PYCC 5710]|eukprot:CCG82420.1 Putative uncharacterized protein [Taphrina deformans PYCC 5710]